MGANSSAPPLALALERRGRQLWVTEFTPAVGLTWSFRRDVVWSLKQLPVQVGTRPEPPGPGLD